MSDIAKRLRVSAKYNSFNGGFYERSIVKSQMEEAADYIEQLERDLIETRAALEVVVQQLRVELAAQCWCDPKTSHIEMNVDLADAVAYRIDRMTDKDFLLWIYARLKNVHMEDPHVDYMYKLYDIAEKQDTIAERRHDKAMMNGIRKEARELAAQCWCDPKTSHIEMNVDLADAVAYRIDRLLSQIADLRTEVAKNHAAWKVADEDCRNLTEKVIPNIRTELTEALAALLSARSLLAMAADWSTWFEEKYANTIKTAMGRKL